MENEFLKSRSSTLKSPTIIPNNHCNWPYKIMAGSYPKKRKADEPKKWKRPVKKFKKQTDYDSSSSADEQEEDVQEFQAVNLQDSDEENATGVVEELPTDDDEPNLDNVDSEEDVTDASHSDSEDDESDTNSNPNLERKKKRNDPEAFATSMSKILGSKLSTNKRSDPVLSRSVVALQASKEITDQALEQKARKKLREEKRTALDKGRVKDVLGASTAFDAANGNTGQSVAEIMETEKRLRKTAQRGVVKLFNAVRAAQVKGEEATREAQKKRVVGFGRREEKVVEMSKKGFLDLIAGSAGGQTIEET